MNTTTGETLDFWITGWSTFVHIPQTQADGSVEQVVRGVGRRYGADTCALSFLYHTHVKWNLGDHAAAVRAGSLQSSDPFAASTAGALSACGSLLKPCFSTSQVCG